MLDPPGIDLISLFIGRFMGYAWSLHSSAKIADFLEMS